MTNKLRRIVLSGLSLILIGGTFSPIVAQAATTDPTSATSKEPTTLFTSIESPYHLITTANGSTIKDNFYPTATSQSYTLDEILADDFVTKFPAGVDSQLNPAQVQAAANLMVNFAKNGLVANPSESLAQYEYLRKEQEMPGVTDAALFTKFYTITAYAYAWSIKVAAQQKLGTIDYETAKKEYESSARPIIMEMDKITDTGFHDNLDTTFQTEQNFEDGMPQNLNWAPMLLLDRYSDEELATLNPVATRAANTKILAQPLSNFIHKKDGQVVADGILSVPMTTGPIAYVFGEQPTTPTPTATSQPITVHYVDEQGKTLKPDKTLTGSVGDSYKTEPLNIAGYKLVKTTGDESGKFTSAKQTVTYTYHKVAADIAVKNSVIYATKKIGLYGSPTFTKPALKQTYAKKARMNRPTFKVIGTATSKNGVKRYKVKDLNGKGTTGYITANAGYVAPLYYANQPTKVTVINPKGLNAYSKKNLTHKRSHYQQGQVLRVKKIVNHNLTTRLQLSNGKYVSANKKLVIAGKYTMPKHVRAKTGINRYGTANLTKRNKHFAKGKTLKVTGWAYSNAHNFRKGDTLRYRVSGGYITGNKRFVSPFK